MEHIPSNIFMSYKLLQSKTPQELEESMLRVQIENKSPVNFTAPTFSEGKWSTWYLHDFSKDIDPRAKLKITKGIN